MTGEAEATVLELELTILDEGDTRVASVVALLVQLKIQVVLLRW
jgi:hypothetical protein